MVVTDHLSKPDYGLAGDRQVMPVDSGQKLPSVNGAGLRMVEIVKPHKPVDGQPNQGWCRIFVARDKAGGLGAARHEHPGKVQPPIADLFIDVAASGLVTLSLRPTESDDAVSYAVDQRDDHRLLSWVEGHPGKSQNEVVTGTGWGKSKALDVLNRCVGKGWVQTPPRTSDEPRNRSHEYTLTPNGEVVLKALHSSSRGISMTPTEGPLATQQLKRSGGRTTSDHRSDHLGTRAPVVVVCGGGLIETTTTPPWQ